MSAPVPDATNDYSTGISPVRRLRRRASAGAAPLAVLGAAAALLLALSTALPVVRITGDGPAMSRTGLDQHSVAMALLGLAALPMALGAARSVRPAMAALAALGAAALVVALGVDLPAALDEGLVGARFAAAEAAPAAGFYVETLGGALLVLCGGMLLLAPSAPRRAGRADRPDYQR